MRPKKSITALQWTQLYSLSLAHFFADMLLGMLPAILPTLRTQFNLSLNQGVVLISVCFFTANIVQILIGHLRPDKKRPFFWNIGLVICVAICFCGLLPGTKHAHLLLVVLAIITPIGTAFTHPEGLRAVHFLRRITPATGTALFLNGGVFGFCAGGLLAAAVVHWLGLKGLLLFVCLPLTGIVATKMLRIRLAVDKPHRPVAASGNGQRVPFWLLFLMVIPFTTSATVFPALIPTRLNELGFNLSFGALPGTLWGVGAIAGTFFWSKMADKKSPLPIVVISSILVIPMMVLYLILIKSPYSIWLLLPGGFGAFAGSTIIVSMARYSAGANLGRRMGIMSGGGWGVASLILMALGTVAEKYSVAAILNLSWLGYFLTAVIGLVVIKTQKSRTPATSEGAADVTI